MENNTKEFCFNNISSIIKCPICQERSYIKVPLGKIYKNKWGSDLHIANEYSYNCLNKNCKSISETFRINTPEGDKFLLPWYKQIF